MAHADNGHVGADGAVLADDDVGHRGVENEAIAVDERGWCDAQAEAVVDVDGALDVGNTRTGHENSGIFRVLLSSRHLVARGSHWAGRLAQLGEIRERDDCGIDSTCILVLVNIVRVHDPVIHKKYQSAELSMDFPFFSSHLQTDLHGLAYENAVDTYLIQ